MRDELTAPPGIAEQQSGESSQRESESIERHSRSFSLASRLLPREVARDVRRLYAWCRACDNAVDDEALPLAERRRRMAELWLELERVYGGERPERPESRWLQDLVLRYAIPKEWPQALLTGMESDLDFVRPQTVAELELYCYRAAGVVGLMMSRILGVQSREAEAYACSLGVAMQLTNIARDVAEDWSCGRCYLPTEWLPNAGQAEELPGDDQLRPAVKRLLELAELNYRKGRLGYPFLPARVRWAIRVAADVYREIGQVIREADFRVRERRHGVSTSRKLRIVGQGFWAGIHDRMVSTKDVSSSLITGVAEMKPETLYLAVFGLSLTGVMATAMFALVGLNPKADTYDYLPWIYSGGSACAALILGWWSRRLAKQLPTEATPSRGGKA